MLKVTVTISGEKRIIAQLKSVSDAFTNWKPELQSVGDFLKEFYTNDVFETEGSVIGRKWRPLSEQYEFQKRKLYPGRGILEATGTLRRGYEVDEKRNSMELTNKVPYGIYQQQGRGVHERVLVRMDSKRKKDVVKIFEKGIIKKVKTALT